jgi:undecaprenyl-diphosphatase
MEFWQAAILAIVEGLTEYIPVSSTGHLIIASSLLGIETSEVVKNYTVIVQFGAILAAVIIYFERLKKDRSIYLKLLVGFLPAGILGFLLKNKIDEWLESPWTVGIALLVGGFVLVFVDRLNISKKSANIETAEKFKSQVKSNSTSARIRSTENTAFTLRQALLIGISQCVALMPGVSRSAATIVGGMAFGLSRQAAAEFSFLLAIPTLAAATLYKTLKIFKAGQLGHDLPLLIFGNIISFIVGYITIKAFIGYLQKRGFLMFGIYRIIVGAGVLIALSLGHSLKLI